MVMSPAGLGTKNNCAGEGQQQFSSQFLKGYASPFSVLTGISSRRKRINKINFNPSMLILSRVNIYSDHCNINRSQVGVDMSSMRHSDDESAFVST
jgi:hypothetical protein